MRAKTLQLARYTAATAQIADLTGASERTPHLTREKIVTGIVPTSF